MVSASFTPDSSSSENIARHARVVSELFDARPHRANAQPHVELPFRIRIARTVEDLRKCLDIRASCYQRHFGSSLATVGEAEPEDFDRGAILLLAESKETGDPLGSLRLMTNRYSPLSIEHRTQLPPKFEGRVLADIRRLSVVGGARGRWVKLILFKSVYLCSLANQVRYLVIGAREPLIRDYESFYFQDVAEGGLEVEMLGRPHRVLYLDVNRMPINWEQQNIRWHKAFFDDFHPDIEVFGSVSPGWIHGRRDEPRQAILPASAAMNGGQRATA